MNFLCLVFLIIAYLNSKYSLAILSVFSDKLPFYVLIPSASPSSLLLHSISSILSIINLISLLNIIELISFHLALL